MKKCYDFDDVLIKPIPSKVNSRTEVDISVKLSDFLILQFPLIAAPMRGIVDAKFASLLSDLGGICILHRFYDSNEEEFNEINSLALGSKKYGVSIELHNKNYDLLLEYEPSVINIDIANAYTESVLKYCEEVKNYISKNNINTLLMSGNICTRKGVINLRDSGVDIVRYGIGGGGLCSTRNVTGIGVPQISALLDTYDINGVIICADGGLRTSGDFVKAIVAGADCGMAGSLFGQTYESPAENTIFGMASRKLNEMKYSQIKSIEGIEKAVEKKYSLAQFVDEFSWGIRSAGTYLNAKNLDEIRKNGEFVIVGTGSIKNL